MPPYINHNMGKTYREMKALRCETWVESFLIDVGNDLPGDIDTTYTLLSKMMTHTIVGSNTLALVSTTGFTGNMLTAYEIEITKAGAMGVAEFKWSNRTYLGGVVNNNTSEVLTAADNNLGNGVRLNFTGITSVLGDKYIVHGCGSWHIPASGKNSFLTSFSIRMYDSTKSAKAAYVRLWVGDFHVWEILDSSYAVAYWRTPLYLLGNDIIQYKVEFAEATKGDIEYVYMTVKGWDEPVGRNV